VTNTFDPISSRYNKVVRREMKEVLAPRLQALEDVEPTPLTNVEFHDRVTIDSSPEVRTPQIAGAIAAATLAPAFGLLVLSLMNFLVPVIEALQFRTMFFENGISNLTIVLTFGAWLFTWVGLYDAWHDRTVSRTKLYTVTLSLVTIAAVLLIPAVYRLMES
jgi:hypothetical protein